MSKKSIRSIPRYFYNFSKRLTFRYRAEFSDNDKWARVGDYRILKSRHSASGRSDSARRVMTLRVKSSCSPREIVSALEDSLAYGCSCEHDCCGHVFCHFVEVRRTRRNEYFVVQHLGRNC
jgi:hypothetical protein